MEKDSFSSAHFNTKINDDIESEVAVASSGNSREAFVFAHRRDRVSVFHLFAFCSFLFVELCFFEFIHSFCC